MKANKDELRKPTEYYLSIISDIMWIWIDIVHEKKR